MDIDNVLIKYVFLDVVAYSKKTTEAQFNCIKSLNRIVKDTINRYHVDPKNVLYVPTGDGMCIALMNRGKTYLTYDIHIKIAKEILRRINVYDSRVKSNWKRFRIRIGIHELQDAIINDINNRENVAGAGINNARRIMDFADANQVLVSSTVYENLHPHKEYLHSFSDEYTKETKHGALLRMYQLIEPNANGLDIMPPVSLTPKTEADKRLTNLTAYYLAHSIKNEQLIISQARKKVKNRAYLKILLWFLAKNSAMLSERSVDSIHSYGFLPSEDCISFEDQLNWFITNVDYDVAKKLSDLTLQNAVPRAVRLKYFKDQTSWLVVNSDGKQKLVNDWPDIWGEFALN